MKKLWAVLALVGALAMVPVFQAEAGGNGAQRSEMYVAEWGGPQGENSIIVTPRVDVGHVIANSSAKGKLRISIALKDAEPDTDWTVRVLPSPNLEYAEALSTDGDGEGEFTVTVDTSGIVGTTARFSVVLRDGDRGESPHVYRSERLTVSLKRK